MQIILRPRSILFNGATTFRRKEPMVFPARMKFCWSKFLMPQQTKENDIGADLPALIAPSAMIPLSLWIGLFWIHQVRSFHCFVLKGVHLNGVSFSIKILPDFWSLQPKSLHEAVAFVFRWFLRLL